MGNLENIRIFVESLPALVFVATGGKVLYAGNRLALFFGFESNLEIIDKEVVRLFPGMKNDPGEFDNVDRKNLLAVKSDGTNIPVLISISNVKIDNELLDVFYIEDASVPGNECEMLKQNREVLINTINAVPLSIFWKDNNSIYLGCNKAFAESLGISDPNWITGKTDFDLPLPYEAAMRFRQDDKEVINTKKPRHKKVEVTTPHDPSKIWSEIVTAPLMDSNNEPFGVIGVYDDITEIRKTQKELLNTERKYARLTESITDAFAVVNMEGKIVEFNPAYAQMLGYAPEEIKKLTFKDITPDKWHVFEDQIISEQVLKTGYSDVYEKEYVRKDGTIFPVELRAYLIKNDFGENEGMWAIIRDITERKKNELSHWLAEQKYSIIFKENPVPLSLNEASTGNFIDVNNALVKLLNVESADVLIGHSPLELGIISSVRKEALDEKSKAIGPENKLQIKFSTLYNRIIDAEISRFCFEFNGGEYWLTSLNDITERMAAEAALNESEALFRAIFDDVGLGVILLNNQGYPIRCNKTIQNMLGYSDDELCKMRFDQFTHPDDVDISLEVHNTLHQKIKDKVKIDKRYITRDNSVIWARSTVSAIKDRDNKIKFIITAIEDITEAKLNEFELAKYRNDLEVIIKERTGELEEVNALLTNEIRKRIESEEIVTNALIKEKELSELKSKFISVTSHEFRTPLTSIYSSVQLLQKYGAEPDFKESRKLYDRIISSVRYLTNLLEDIIILNRADTGRLVFEPDDVNLYWICRQLVEDAKQFAGENITINYKFDIQKSEYYLDEKLLRFIVSNLLSNAVKYSGEGKSVDLHVGSDNEYIVFTVTDEGIGIPPESQKQLFEPFTRGSNVNRISGTGLGLSIVKRSVELHGGVISFESMPGKGTKFFVKIPLKRRSFR